MLQRCLVLDLTFPKLFHSVQTVSHVQYYLTIKFEKRCFIIVNDLTVFAICKIYNVLMQFSFVDFSWA